MTQRLRQRVGHNLPDNERPILDASFELRQVQAAALPRFVPRLVKNFTARRNKLPAPKGSGRPREYGDYVRPLPHLRTEFGDELVRSAVKGAPPASTFCVAAIYASDLLDACNPYRARGCAAPTFSGKYSAE